ncbi:MAG: ATP-grasp domain-containing protein [Betaproteobacteria bacterium]|nr:MAG: ATP-grasp domain-containing protein [Betaproteobacteria bacterium]
MPRDTHERTLVLFNYDWDQREFARLADRYPHDSRGFDLFSFPSNAQLAWFDMERFVDRLAKQVKRRGWTAVTSNHEQFGALAAALLAEKMGWPGTPVDAILSCQHKLYARQILDRVSPEINIAARELPCEYGAPIPDGLAYPAFAKPVKAAFSVLARTVANRDELHAHTRFGAWELWVIRHLVEPFDRVMRTRLPNAPTAHRMMLEDVFAGQQYNLDGYMLNGELHVIGCVDSIMYPGTQAFMRFDYPSRLAPSVIAQFKRGIGPFLKEINFTHGLFNVEFFVGEDDQRLKVIEFNPRMASQFSDLYRRVDGIDLHEYAFALAHGIDPATLPRSEPTAGAASSFVYRSFDAALGDPSKPNAAIAMPSAEQQAQLHKEFPDALLFTFPKDKSQIARDFKWLGSYRYGILHLGGRDEHDLRERCERASAVLRWRVPYTDGRGDALNGLVLANA